MAGSRDRRDLATLYGNLDVACDQAIAIGGDGLRGDRQHRGANPAARLTTTIRGARIVRGQRNLRSDYLLIESSR